MSSTREKSRSGLAREFNHFPADIVSDSEGNPLYELVGADHFAVDAEQAFTNPVLGPEQAAVDLVWAPVGGGENLIWPMTYLYRSCAEIDDAITRERCESLGGSIRTFELARNDVGIRTTTTVADTLRPVGTGDFDDDGRVDIIFQDQGIGDTSGLMPFAVCHATRASAGTSS